MALNKISYRCKTYKGIKFINQGTLVFKFSRGSSPFLSAEGAGLLPPLLTRLPIVLRLLCNFLLLLFFNLKTLQYCLLERGRIILPKATWSVVNALILLLTHSPLSHAFQLMWIHLHCTGLSSSVLTVLDNFDT